ncbi:Dinitrogenase iron-molybdenum cofactor biosynthesis [Trichormus variabilis ATCC 29413]|uniref:Dinitrogenase iron-molybdenum cofactor biosynthesis n=2 Tax=Anabaena variabilis TaxID=264691 RepID=Q3MG00_TRIV2|nr:MULTISPECIES: NifB/NifX family molybdenum-iron cluster-binding protein [Nostocaceae]ABA20086.1 Dinitrogenase iron-molybdenum cofactor biosynthesis [Trichormus variabilis ATCC 29413]MBC1214698.1 dinitrogenase iron-molybdenum cofactor biosynthesis protein [Trichormus variabilis ARAD]MBC1255379.1 dinitrogenase iron-molybdenum cofactor biosynthesis protein [Trichormus variabilis V5]MBC1268659.1 dinitrogenase iron-molybdenum cofactor biosynthesis protein [Trichormus variabilis FSR]MBC1303618.1 d
MKIAFATSDRINVDAHFGWAQEIDVYEISDGGYEFIETLSFNKETPKPSEDTIEKGEGGCKHGKSDCKKAKKEEEQKPKVQNGESDDKVAQKIAALSDCKIVYVASIGGIAAAKLIKKGVMPVKPRSKKEDIIYLLNRLVQTLKGNPPPWLRKALRPNQESLGELESV